MNEEAVLEVLDDWLNAARAELMRFAFEDAELQDDLWFVVRESAVVVRRLRAGEATAPELCARMDRVLATIARLSHVVAWQLEQPAPVPWKRL